MNYYRRFIEGIAELEFPLRCLTRKGVEFCWTNLHQRSFEFLKSKLICDPILAHFDELLPIVLKTDASGLGVGVILSQVHKQGEKVVAYDSHLFSQAERNYPTIQKEGLGIMYGFKDFQTLSTR